MLVLHAIHAGKQDKYNKSTAAIIGEREPGKRKVSCSEAMALVYIASHSHRVLGEE